MKTQWSSVYLTAPDLTVRGLNLSSSSLSSSPPASLWLLSYSEEPSTWSLASARGFLLQRLLLCIQQHHTRTYVMHVYECVLWIWIIFVSMYTQMCRFITWMWTCNTWMCRCNKQMCRCITHMFRCITWMCRCISRTDVIHGCVDILHGCVDVIHGCVE